MKNTHLYAGVFILLALLNIVAAQSRACSTAKCGLKDTFYPCTPTCCDDCQFRRVLNSNLTRRLDCPSKTINGAQVLVDGCGNNNIQHSIGIEGTDTQLNFFNTDGWNFQLRNKVSTGILNEFDDNGDGLFDRAEVSGTLVPIDTFNSSNPTLGSFRIFVNLTSFMPNFPTGRVKSNAYHCNNAPVTADALTLYYYDVGEGSFIEGQGEFAGFRALLEPTIIRRIGLLPVQIGFGANNRNFNYGMTMPITPFNFTYDPVLWGNKPELEVFRGNLRFTGHFDLACSCRCPDDILPTNVCGNDIVEPGEECEGSQGLCCDANTCKFKPSSFACRPAVGPCDVPEFCAGNSAVCDTLDKSASNTTLCITENFCEFKIPTNCTGNSNRNFGFQCNTQTAILGTEQLNLLDFDITSEGEMNIISGDIGGRILSYNNLNLGAVSVSSGLINDPNYVPKPYGIVAGHNLTWSGGTLGGEGEEIFVVENFAGPGDLTDLRDNLFCPPGPQPPFPGNFPDDLCSFFQFEILETSFSPFYWASAFNFYVFQNIIAKTEFPPSVVVKNPNKVAEYSLEFSGIHVTCADPNQDEYYVEFNVKDLNVTTWYYFTNCNLAARWIFKLVRNDSAPFPFEVLTFKGGNPPVIAEKTVWISDFSTSVDILITGTEFRGSLITFQSVAMKDCNVVGKIYALNSVSGESFSQQHPSCSLPTPLPLLCLVTDFIPAKSRVIPCLGAPNFAVGDNVLIEGETCVVTKKTTVRNHPNSQNLVCQKPLQKSYPPGTVARVVVKNPSVSLLKSRDLKASDDVTSLASSRYFSTLFIVYILILLI